MSRRIRNPKHYARVGSRRAARLMAEQKLRETPKSVKIKRGKNATGLKTWRVFTLDGFEFLTPYARKELARRRKAGKAARQARRVMRFGRANTARIGHPKPRRGRTWKS